MPCGDVTDYDYEIDSLSNKLKAATRAACELARVLKIVCKQAGEPNCFSGSLSEATKKWVYRHEEIDRRRQKEEEKQKRREELKKKALKKVAKHLSREEREVIGLTWPTQR